MSSSCVPQIPGCCAAYFHCSCTRYAAIGLKRLLRQSCMLLQQKQQESKVCHEVRSVPDYAKWNMMSDILTEGADRAPQWEHMAMPCIWPLSSTSSRGIVRVFDGCPLRGLRKISSSRKHRTALEAILSEMQQWRGYVGCQNLRGLALVDCQLKENSLLPEHMLHLLPCLR